jgi:predicted neuraminidase
MQSTQFYESDLIFPPEAWHNHASCIVELPAGELLVCWYHGSGERSADDVLVKGARRRPGESGWGLRFLMADTIDYPDCNPCMFIDRKDRLWLIYVTILANEWHTALLKYRISSDYQSASAPRWESGEVLHITPGDEFMSAVGTACDGWDTLPNVAEHAGRVRRLAQDKLSRRLGWMPRAHPTVLSDGRVVLPLYSDGFDFSLMALSDNDGDTWHVSTPIISLGGVQPSVVEKNNGVLVAYMRDNGPAPNRIMVSESRDRGETWTEPNKMTIPNPGSGLEAIRLRDGRWLMVCNDTEEGRHQLAVMTSEDEGVTWGGPRYLENDVPGTGSYSYPSVIQSTNGTIHVTYSAHIPNAGAAIKWAHFDESWLLHG